MAFMPRSFSVGVPPPKCDKYEEAESCFRITTSERPSERGSEPEPQRRRTVQTPLTQPAVADVQEAEAGGALGYREQGKKYIVKP